jgi:hypothetical protein
MIQFGTTLANALLGTGSLQSLINNSFIYIYAGNVPAAGDAAPDGTAVLLAKISANNGGTTGITWNGPIASGVLQKTSAETWSGPVTTTGVAAWFRICVGTDTGSGAAVAGNYRVQGTVGTTIASDMVVASTNFVSSNTETLSNGQIAIPT